MDLHDALADLLATHGSVMTNPARAAMIDEVIANKEAMVARCGALATWTSPESTGRSPKDTLTVRRAESEGNIDWDSPNNIALDPETFDMVFEDAMTTLKGVSKVYRVDRVIGADPAYALPVQVVSDKALSVLFADNMFRPVPDDIGKSIFAEQPFTLVALPLHKLDSKKYEGRLRYIDKEKKQTSDMVVAMDMDRRICIVYGSDYCGSVKKAMFTVMNYLLPLNNILSLHCSANEGKNGDTALLLGLSGTGKTTLSADPSRALLGDDEHGWGENGIANYENGCYAKLIDLNPKKEPEIFHACFHDADPREHGAIIENAMIYPNGEFDLGDGRFTENSRGSYPLTFLSNIKPSSVGGHPKTILFLTADAFGVLPPVAKLTKQQAMLWFLMGYTSKLAGTETGITEPQTTFSRFFGAPFMPLNPDIYAGQLGKKLDEHETNVYLVNTGWSGGPYGVGSRMDITLTRAMVDAALSGGLEGVEFERDPFFKVMVPKTCPGISDPTVLHPRNTWSNPAAYDEKARDLATQFAKAFDKNYGNKGIDAAIVAECPGK
jgi:phosphoenolpyruvate carboxykinase (ATP)